jgi:hypothetical protein
MAAMAVVQAQNAKNMGGKFPKGKKKTKSETFNFFSKRCISAGNDSRMLNLGSKCADKSKLEQHKTP